MDWMWKSALTAASVLLVLAAARRCGPNVAGHVAAMPLITGPALGWLAHEQGVGFAVRASVSCVAACSMLSAFALLYAVACRRAGIGVAVLAGSAGAMAMTLPAIAASGDLVDALVLALGCTAIACRGLRDGAAGAAAPAASRSTGSLALVAVSASAMSALAAAAGPLLGAFAAGLLASVPVVSGAVVLAEHAAGRRCAVAQFLRGYVGGLAGRAAFGAAFAVLAGPVGVAGALLLAMVAAGLCSTLGSGRASLAVAARALRTGTAR